MRLVFVGSAGTRKQNDRRKNDDAVLTRQAEYGLFKVQGSTVQQFKVQQFRDDDNDSKLEQLRHGMKEGRLIF